MLKNVVESARGKRGAKRKVQKTDEGMRIVYLMIVKQFGPVAPFITVTRVIGINVNNVNQCKT